jgi:hypothetical protein
LGVGGGGGERPVRAQIIVALVVALTLVAVPLYLMRRPSAHPVVEVSAGTAESAKPAVSAAAPELPEVNKPPERIRLAPLQRVRCGATPKGGQEGNLCDSLAPIEEALAKAIRENAACLPKLKSSGNINFVLNVDFTKKSLHLFPGASGDFRGPQARKATNCVQRALPKPEWDSIHHQYRYYTIAYLTTFLPESAVPNANGAPKFD